MFWKNFVELLQHGTRKFFGGGIEMPLILALIGVALNVPHEIVGGLLALFLIKELV